MPLNSIPACFLVKYTNQLVSMVVLFVFVAKKTTQRVTTKQPLANQPAWLGSGSGQIRELREVEPRDEVVFVLGGGDACWLGVVITIRSLGFLKGDNNRVLYL